MKTKVLLLLAVLSSLALAQQNALVVQQTFSAAGSSAWYPVAGYTNHTLTWSQVGSTTVTGCAVQVDSSATGTGSGSAGGIITSQSATSNGTTSVTSTTASYARITVTGCSAGSIKVTYSALNSGVSKGNITGTSPIVVTGNNVSCPTCGTGSGTVTGTGTANTISKWTSTSGIGNSQVTDDGTNPTASPLGFDVSTTGSYDFQIVNNGATGTVLNKTVCDDGSGKGIVCPHATSTTNAVLGFCISGCGTTSNARVSMLGWPSVIYDNQSTARHYAINSTTVDGDLHDTGSGTLTAGQPNFFVFTANAGAGTAGTVRMLIADDFVQASPTAIYKLQVNGTGLTAGDTVNVNGTTPADAGAYGNCAFATSKSGTTDSVSLNCDTPIGNAVAGINPAVAVQAATTAAGDTSTFTYLNGVSGVGATLTGPTNNVAVTIDGFTFTATGQRLLVKNDTQSPSGAVNGVYSLTLLQGSLNKPVLTRALDYDMPSDINNTGAIPVINGTANATTQWVLTSAVTNVGVDPLTYSQFSANPANNVTAASAATATSQVCTSSGSSKTCTYIDFPDVHIVPAANCNNTTAGNGWSIGSGGTVSCRAGTNNLGGFVAITDTSSTFATFQIAIPEDWDSASRPYIRFQLASTDATNNHTIIPEINVACYKGDGSTTDDVAANGFHSLSTVTLNGNANRFWSTSNVQMNSTDMTGCVAGSLMQVTVGRATDTATQAAFYSATITFPRLLVVQAN